MRRLLCRLGWHRWELAYYSYTCDVWACQCGHLRISFCHDPRDLAEVEMLNQWAKLPEAKEKR